MTANSPQLPSGSWPSPITAEAVANGSGGAGWPTCQGAETWWCEADPMSATVNLMRCRPGHDAEPLLAPTWSVRNDAIGYGGRPYLVVPEAETLRVVFTESHDRRLYTTVVGPLGSPSRSLTTPRPLTPPDQDGVSTNYADMIVGPDGHEIWCIRETTQPATTSNMDPASRTRRDIIAVPLDGDAATRPERIRTVARSHHFLSGIRLSPDGRRLAWIGWDHPAMPWDGTSALVGELEDGVVSRHRQVLGGPRISVPQVEWADATSLYAMADPQGWWNLHRITIGATPETDTCECVLPMNEECAGALWRVGATWFAVTAAGVVFAHGVGAMQLSMWVPETGELTPLAAGWQQFGSQLAGTGPSAAEAAIAAIGGSPNRASTVLRVPLTRPDALAVGLTPDEQQQFAPWNPSAQRRTAPGKSGREVHFVYYPATNPVVDGLPAEAPPLLIDVHGGPTSSTGATPDLEFGLFCSRGFTIASVDYAGSTGYGRAYRDRLRHQWGVVDVEDCIAVAEHLIEQGLADPDRVAIRGGSAGGWTTLACLASTDLFCAGAVYYPIADPFTWSGANTHDFESRYLRSLIGDLPQHSDRYRTVSPLENVEQISAPLIMLQGADDPICRPDQAQRVVDAARARGLWHRHLVFPGEGHGFRLHTSVADSLRAEAELYNHAMGVALDLDPQNANREDYWT